MSQQLRTAIVGTGMIATRAHVPAVMACPKTQLTTLVDPAEARARAVAEKIGSDIRIAGSIEEVLNDIDAAVIATPNETHCPIATACLENGVHVLIEKPLAKTAEEGQQIVDAAERNNAVAAVGYQTRFMESVRLLKQLLDEGFFGHVSQFAYQYGTRGGWAPVTGYGLGATGGGVLVVTGTHFLDRMVHWFGYPNTVRYWDDAEGGPEANCIARFSFDRGNGHPPTEGEVRLSKTEPLTEGFIMKTDRGTVIVRTTDDKGPLLLPDNGPNVQMELKPRIAVPTGNIRVALVTDFAEACLEGRAPYIPAKEGLLTQRLTDALYASREPLQTI